MTAYRRFHVPGGTYFFTVRLQERGSDLLLRHIHDLRAAYAACFSDRPFQTLAICVLPDHLHAVWRLPPGDADFPTRWRRIKSQVSRAIAPGEPVAPSRARRGERGIWQRRFWEHRVRDATDLDRHLRYCWTDPVRSGLVERAQDWPHSSLHRDVTQGHVDVTAIEPPPPGCYGE